MLAAVGLSLFDHGEYMVRARVRQPDWSIYAEDADAVLAWLQQHRADGVIATSNPALVYLRTGTPTIQLEGLVDRAALTEQPVGKGRVMVWASTVDNDWNDLAVQPVLLPFVHQLVKHASGYAPAKPAFTVGDPFDPAVSAAAAQFFWRQMLSDLREGVRYSLPFGNSESATPWTDRRISTQGAFR